MGSGETMADTQAAPKPPAADPNDGGFDGCATTKLPTNGTDVVTDKLKNALGNRESFRDQLLELQEWEQPANSASVLVLGCALFYLTSGEDGYSVVGLLCLGLVLRVAAVAGARHAQESTKNHSKLRSVHTILEKAVISMETWVPLPSPEQVANVTHGAASVVEAKTNSVCKALAAATEPSREGRRMLKVVVSHLAVVLLLVNLLVPRTLLFLYFLQQLLWPATYARFKTQIDDASNKVWTHAQPHVEAVSAKASEAMGKAQQAVADSLEKLKVKAQEATTKAQEETPNTDNGVDTKKAK